MFSTYRNIDTQVDLFNYITFNSTCTENDDTTVNLLSTQATYLGYFYQVILQRKKCKLLYYHYLFCFTQDKY